MPKRVVAPHLKATYPNKVVELPRPEPSPTDLLRQTFTQTSTQITAEVQKVAASVDKLASGISSQPAPQPQDNSVLIAAVKELSGQFKTVANLVSEQSKLIAALSAPKETTFQSVRQRDGQWLTKKITK